MESKNQILNKLPRIWQYMVENYIDVHKGRKEVKVGIGYETLNKLAPEGPTREGIEKLTDIRKIIADAYSISHDEVGIGFCQDFETLTAGYPMTFHYEYRYSDGSPRTETKYYYGPRN